MVVGVVVGDVVVDDAILGVVDPTRLLGTQHTLPAVSQVAALLSCTKPAGHDAWQIPDQ